MATEAQPFQEQVALRPEVSTTNYAAGFSNAAMTPTWYGQLGADVALKASVELSKKRGIQAGLDPYGDALLPITKADEAYVKAYNNQAYSTIANQGNALMYEADENMASLNMLSPEDLSTYKQNVQQGLEDILKFAPQDAKMELFNNFNQQLISNMHTYQSRYIKQQKAEQQDNLELALSNAEQSVHEAFMSGDPKKAQAALDTQKRLIDEGGEIGLYSKSQVQSQKIAANINYRTNELIQKGIAAEAEGKSAEWLDSLIKPESKPADMSWSEWESATDNAQKYMGHRKSFSNQAAQVLSSNGYVDIMDGKMTPSRMQQYEESLKDYPLLKNNLHIQYSNWLHQQQKTESEVDTILSRMDDSDYLGNATTANLNKAYKKQAKLIYDSAQAEGNPISEAEADFRAAAGFSVPVPQYNDFLSHDITSGEPGRMQQAIHYYKRLNELGGNRTAPFLDKPNAIAMMNNFESFINAGKTPEEAAAYTQDIVNRSKTDKDYASRINQLTTEYLNDNFNTSDRGFQNIRKKLPISGNVTIENPGAITNIWRKQFSTFMQYTDGNKETAEKMVLDSFKATWGITKVNGRESYVQYPPENFVDGGSQSIPLVQMDLYNQLKKPLEYTKDLYDRGLQSFYYELEPGVSLEDLTKARKLVETEQSWNPWNENKQKLNKIQEGLPVKLTRIFRNGERQEWQTYLQGNPFQSISMSTGKLQGGYDVMLYNPETGKKDNFMGVYEDRINGLSYNPNNNWIKENFFTVNGTTESEFYASEKNKREAAVLKYNQPVIPGNIDLTNRPKVQNQDGTYSTVSTITVDIESGQTALIPTIIDGKKVSDREAMAHFRRTRQHMGIFKSQTAANAYDKALHEKMGWTGSGNKWDKK